jgi:putative endonuclease
MKNTTTKGLEAEGIACEYLQNLGYQIVARNVRKKFSEIDIVAKKNGVYRFVEVKSGVGFDPVYNLTQSKLKKIIKGVGAYIALHKIDAPYCIDLVVVRDGECELYENITL